VVLEVRPFIQDLINQYFLSKQRINGVNYLRRAFFETIVEECYVANLMNLIKWAKHVFTARFGETVEKK
jgi:hypothetical protein